MKTYDWDNYYSKEMDKILHVDEIGDMFECGDIDSNHELFQCEVKQAIRHDLIDLVKDSLYNEFGEECDLRSGDYKKLEQIQVDIDKILSNYKSLIPDMKAPIKLSDILGD